MSHIVSEFPATETMSQPLDDSNSPTRRSCVFYKLMVTSIIQDMELKIPTKFVRKYADELLSFAYLTVPSGRIWLVELSKDKQRLWFKAGWRAFLEYYSIHAGHFLVFTYQGNSKFIVHIYDLTDSEIKYPDDTPFRLQEIEHDKQCTFHNVKAEEDHDDSVGYDNLTESSAPMHKASVGNLHQRANVHNSQASFRLTRDIGIQVNGTELTDIAGKVALYSSNEAEQTIRIEQETEPYVDERKSLGKRKAAGQLPGVKVPCETSESKGSNVVTQEKERTIRVAEKFKSNNPHCKVILRSSLITKKLRVPSDFAYYYLNRISGVVTLQVSDGKQWHVQLNHRHGSVMLTKGWIEFARDNNLDKGDVCVFELIPISDLTLKVTMFRVMDIASH